MSSEEWVTAAMKDTAEVAEILLRFKLPQQSAVIPLRWGRRLPRTRPLPPPCPVGQVGCDSGEPNKRMEDGVPSSRCSPTTPLSWSGGGDAASSPCPDGGLDYSSSFSLSPNRSKGLVVCETTSTITKKFRKKKTYAELKEEESLLLKQRTDLNKELAILRATLEERSARNESLKRLKFDLNVEASKYSSVAADEKVKSIVGQAEQKEHSSFDCMPSALQTPAKVEDNPEVDACETDNAVSNHDRPVFLFDLNMMPLEEESGIDASSGMR